MFLSLVTISTIIKFLNTTTYPLPKITATYSIFQRIPNRGADRRQWSTSLAAFFMWPQKAIAVEVNHVIWIICNPYFCFPRNVSRVFSEFGTVWEGCYVNKPNSAILKCFFKFNPTLGRNRALPFSLWRKITKDISLIKARCNKECSLVLSRCLCKTYQSY